MNRKQKIIQLFKNFKPLKAQDFSMIGSTAVSTLNTSPPMYIISLIINALEFKKYKEDEKINWFTTFEFNNFIFIIHDYKFSTWSIRISNKHFDEDNEKIPQTVEEIIKLFTKAAPLIDKELNKILETEITAENYYFNNTFHTLLRIHSFYKDLVNEKLMKHKNAKNETIEKESKIPAFPKIIQYINNKGIAAQEVAYLTFSLMNSFYSTLEFILDIFVVLKTPSINFSSFQGKNWRDKFKTVFDLSDDRVFNIYNELIKIKQNYRNPLSHGLNHKTSLLVPFPEEGLLPLSYEFISKTPYFNLQVIEINECKKIIKLFDDFFKYIKTKEPYAYYLQYIDAGFSIPRDKNKINDIKQYMSSKKDFEDYINRQHRIHDMIENRDN